MNPPIRRSSLPPPSSTPSASLLPQDGFIADSTLAVWIRTGVATREGQVVSMRAGADLILADALRVLGRRDGESDPYGLTGRVLTLRSLIDRGGTLHANGLRLGSSTYDVEFGHTFQAIRQVA